MPGGVTLLFSASNNGMKLPFTQKKLIEWAGMQVFKDAEVFVNKGGVLEASFESPDIKGSVLWNNRPLNTGMTILPDGNVENNCPCWANQERGMICTHVIALALTLVKRATDPLREEKYRAELRRASRLAQFKESDYIQRMPPGYAGGIPASIVITISENWMEELASGRVTIHCEAEYDGKRRPLETVPCNIPLCFEKNDETLLYVLDDISEGPARNSLSLGTSDFINLLALFRGKTLMRTGGAPITVNEAALTTFLRMDIDHENGELILNAHTELPFMKTGEFPLYIISGKSGWAYGADNFWPLERTLPLPYHAIYREPAIITRPDVLRFMRSELPALAREMRIESDIALDLFNIDPARPVFRLLIKGSPASLSATLSARYNGIELVARKPDAREHFGIPDPGDIMRYTVRNMPAEEKALGQLRASGFAGDTGDSLSSIVGKREVLNFLGGSLPRLRRLDWQINLEGKVSPFFESLEFATPVVHINEPAGSGWFEVGFDFEDAQGQSLSPSEIQTALLKGESFVTRGDRISLVDADAIEAMRNIFSDCDSTAGDKPGCFRLSQIYAPFVKSSLDTLDGIDVEETPEWRMRAGQLNRAATIEPVRLGKPLDDILRPYQKDGVNWLRFLELNGFCGLLADEMGLGKTVQTLAWLSLDRSNPDARSKPALIICPTSLVQNWIDEAKRFVPAMNTLAMTGAERHDFWEVIPKVDAVVTSYALLRRDLEKYLEHEFSAAILDEAQHIKNRSTQNAVAAKKLKAHHRLVLTGTPVENSVADLWSIMDFLMPSYLGSIETFRRNYELPISRNGAEGEAAQQRLRRKLHPFLMRRLKTEVARDLPPKIEKVATCPLTRDQQMVYTQLLDVSRKKISGLVSKDGFNKARMEILVILMRLRQVCCHLDLLKNENLKSEYPSAKMDLFFELVEEAVDGGHRILVFSQFVSMLTILRAELEKQGFAYCYLDGSTKDRLQVVHKFNSQRDIPLFLISLKAGGTGLNLTGADMVIHFDPWWNPAVEDQATDRAHRIGQKRAVYGIKLITTGTVEEKVLALQKKKKAVINATVETDEDMIQALSWEDVQELLSL